MQNTLYIKILSIVLIYFCAYYAGSLPLRKTNGNGNRSFLLKGEYFSRGVFLGMALLHMLPDAYHHLKPSFHENTYTAVVLIFLGIMAFIICLEKFAVYALQHTEEKPHAFFPYWILVLLSIHAILAGAVLGVDDSLRDIFIIAFAILAHKGSESFALMLTLQKYHLSHKHLQRILLVFSCMTPMGILLGSGLTTLFVVNNLSLCEGYFNIIAAVTFLYIALFHQETTALEEKRLFPKISFFILGLGIMALVALWS